MRVLTAIPVYNEERHVERVLTEVRRHAEHILVVNDGSSDGTAGLLAVQPGIAVVTHPGNRGYGAALASAFAFALEQGYDVLVTMDCDGQHEPARRGVAAADGEQAARLHRRRTHWTARCPTSLTACTRVAPPWRTTTETEALASPTCRTRAGGSPRRMAR